MGFIKEFTNTLANRIAEIIENKVERTRFKVVVQQVRTIDELVRIVESVCFACGRKVVITADQCHGYSVELFDQDGKLIKKIENCDSIKILYEQLIFEMVNDNR